MVTKQEVSGFIKTTFRSVWSLELLLFLKASGDRYWSRADMVASLRGSELVVSQSVDSLSAAGLIGADADGTARYSPASDDLARLVEAVERLYAKSPDAVRRTIIDASSGGAVAFADAFRLRKD